MAVLAVTAVGADRPGIIARVTGVLLEHGGNLADSSMTILGGHFAIVLLVDTKADAADLERDLIEATRDLGLVVAVRPVGHGTASAPATHVLSVYGADRPGIVHAVTSTLAERGVNVTDVNTRLLAGDDPVYAMVLEIALPEGVGSDQLVDALRAEAEAMDVSLHAIDATAF